MPVVLPDWCELVRGDGPVLLVAPHGGRRPPVDPAAPPANLKVNDIHTAELTRELANRLDASAIINHGCDRNRLDLNRRSQVRHRAPWFLELLRDRIATILDCHPRAEILFVHGWNVGQAKCDFGIGARETEDLVPPSGAGLTVSRAYLDERIVPLREAMENEGIATFIGGRYPGSHRNNLLQVFSDGDAAEGATPWEGQFSAWLAERRIETVQLELGVPLRWPGRWRDRFVESINEHFGASPAPARAFASRATPAKRELPTTLPLGSSTTSKAQRAVSLQFYDPLADVGLIAGVGPIGKTTSAARLLLFLGGQRVALFTGEQSPSHGLGVEPLSFEISGHTTLLKFAGPILRVDDGATYLDLEQAFADSILEDIEVDLSFSRRSKDGTGIEFGRIEGTIDVAGNRRPIRVGAYANAAAARGARRLGYTTLAADFGDGCGLLTSLVQGEASRVVEFDGAAPSSHDAPGNAVQISRDALNVTFADGTVVRTHPISRMEILRSLASGGYARVTFGTARFERAGRVGYGIYEYAASVAP